MGRRESFIRGQMDIKDLKHDTEMCTQLDICYFCHKQLMLYTTKKDWTYLSNPDRSPHRKAYVCCNSWSDYNSIKLIEHIEPRRTKDLDGYKQSWLKYIDPKEF